MAITLADILDERQIALQLNRAGKRRRYVRSSVFLEKRRA